MVMSLNPSTVYWMGLSSMHNCDVSLKKTENNEKDDGLGSFFYKKQ